MRNITPVLEKVRPITHRGNGSDPEPEVGLSEGRLSLVHRYMVDAEEARTREPTPVTPIQEQAGREAAERTRRRMERERRRAQEQSAKAARAEPNAGAASEGTRGRAEVLSAAAEEAVIGNGHPDPGKVVRAGNALARADRRAAKQAAREIAALEKREARERKALAKAAARRKPE